MILSVVFAFFWIFFLGAAFGSFMNVVVWRLPQKMSLSRPASHCPRCGKPIRWRHNVPVFGWLILGGKCFDCRAPISPRYPVVEFISGCGFLSIALGAPYDWISDFPFLALDWGFFLTSLGAGMILLDKNRVPFRLLVPLAALFAWGIFHAASGGSGGFPESGFYAERVMFSFFFLLSGTVWLLSTVFASRKIRRPLGILTLVLSGFWAARFWGLVSLFLPIA